MINKLIKIVLLTLPLNVFSIKVQGYPVTVPTIIIILLVIALFVNHRNLDKKITSGLLLFITWSFISTLSGYGIDRFLYSLSVFSVMAMPIAFIYHKSDLDGVIRYLIYGFLFTVPFSCYDLGVTFFNLPPFESFSLLFADSHSSPIGGFYYRVKSTFTEPSYYGIYLNIVLYVLINHDFKYRGLLLFLLIFMIIITVSMTAYILALLILIIYLFKRNVKATKYLVLLVIILMATPVISDVIIKRTERTITSATTQNLFGSEGSRINSIIIMFHYFYEQGFPKWLVGEGYSYYDEWLVNEFGNTPLIHYSRGQIFNSFAVVGISTGVIGLSLYIFMLLGFLRSRYFTLPDIIFHVAIQFSYAMITGYLFWGIFLLLKFKNIQKAD